ncbi:hypothetical protein KY343_02925 [Candidatus Woesearchaeota archaeon]|nr:hypothetical protein [Candidatus Woesearchaeota archaeon]
MEQLTIKVSDLPIRISCPSNSFLKKINQYYKGFIKKMKSKPAFELNIINQRILKRRTGYYISKNTSNELKIKFDITNDYNELQINKNKSKGVYITNKKEITHLNFLLPIIFSIVLNKNAGTELHAASLVKNKKGYLFFGPCYSGKSTISQSFIKKGIILHDDCSLVREVNNKFKIWSVPKNTLLKNICKDNKSAELKACFRIIKSNKNKLVKLSKKDAFKFIKKTSWRYQNYIDRKKQLKVLSNLVKKVNVYNLYFRKKCDFWNLIY